MGSLSIPNSLIHIGLAALGITSLSIAVNIPDQCDAPPLSPPISNLLMQQNPDDTQFHPQQMLLDLGGAQIHPNMPAPYAYSLGKGNPITRVYYRRRFKNKDFATVSQLNSSDKSKRSISATKKRKCIITVKFLWDGIAPSLMEISSRVTNSPSQSSSLPYIMVITGFLPLFMDPDKALIGMILFSGLITFKLMILSIG